MSEHLLDPAILSKIDNYPLLARTVVEGFIAGLHGSLYHGFGSEFVHYRNYSPGDDLKYLDWKVYGRSDKYYVKVFQEETNTNCYIVLDSSASMGYSGAEGRMTKLQYGKIIAACLTYLINRQGDNVGFYGYSDQLKCCVQPGHRSGQVQRICSSLATISAEGAGDHFPIFGQLAELFSRRGIIVLISDFLDVDEEMKKGIRYFKSAHHDCVLFQVLDDTEIEFPFSTDIRFVDSETNDEITTCAELVRDKYVDSFKRFLKDFEDFCWKDNVDHNRITTSSSLMTFLSAFLHRRETFR